MKLGVLVCCFCLLIVSSAWGSIAADNSPISEPAAIFATTLTTVLAPTLMLIALAVVGLVLAFTGHWRALGELAMVILGATLAIKGALWMGYFGMSGTLF